MSLSIGREDFEDIPIFADVGGWTGVRKAFGEAEIDALLGAFNEAVAA